ncbi:MAG: aspartyl protease family protein [Flavobacteriaceae bacterium]
MLNKYTLAFVLFISFLFSAPAQEQSGFRFLNIKSKKTKVKFRLINNLIVIPVNINGKNLSFILDTGVSKTILFNLSSSDSLRIKGVEETNLLGLGAGKPVASLISKGNTLRIKDIISKNEPIYVLVKDRFDLSAKMGITINGIIGYRLLKDLPVKLDYNNKTITFYNRLTTDLSVCKKCQVLPMELLNNKPYINLQAQLDTVGNKMTDIKVLIDSGGSDAAWLFEHTKKNIVTPKLYFRDILGEGLSGTIYGNRSRIPKLNLGRFEIISPTVSFLDSVSTSIARRIKDRNGSVGGNILKRFKIWFDYRNRTVVFKKAKSLKGGFNYNMSGLEVIHNGKRLVKVKEYDKAVGGYDTKSATAADNSITILTRYRFKFRPSYVINDVIKGSPADEVGLLPNDVIISLNRKPAHTLKLSDINNIFQDSDNKRITMLVERGKKRLSFKFRLRKKI